MENSGREISHFSLSLPVPTLTFFFVFFFFCLPIQGKEGKSQEIIRKSKKKKLKMFFEIFGWVFGLFMVIGLLFITVYTVTNYIYYIFFKC